MRFKKFLGGFTLIELLIVIVVIGLTGTYAVPAYIQGQKKTVFRNAVQDVFSLIKEARGYAIASRTSSGVDALEAAVPPGGYGVHFDNRNVYPPGPHIVKLFVDDWDAAGGARVDPSDSASTATADSLYSSGSDTLLKTIIIPREVKIGQLEISNTTTTLTYVSGSGNVIFKPPMAEVVLNGNASTSEIFLDFVITLSMGDDSLSKEISLNKVSAFPLLK